MVLLVIFMSAGLVSLLMIGLVRAATKRDSLDRFFLSNGS